MKKEKGNINVVCRNRKVQHDYLLLQKLEAGIVLQGTEVKSLRDRKVSLSGSYVTLNGGEAWLVGSHIDEYKHHMSWGQYDPKRRRKLLLHKAEIRRLRDGLKQKGCTVVPVSMYFRSGKAKVEIALVRGKKKHDQREDLKRKEAEKEMKRNI